MHGNLESLQVYGTQAEYLVVNKPESAWGITSTNAVSHCLAWKCSSTLHWNAYLWHFKAHKGGMLCTINLMLHGVIIQEHIFKYIRSLFVFLIGMRRTDELLCF